MTDQEIDTAEIAACIWLQVAYRGIQDLPAHDELADKLGRRILEILQHDPIAQQLLDENNAQLLDVTTMNYR